MSFVLSIVIFKVYFHVPKRGTFDSCNEMKDLLFNIIKNICKKNVLNAIITNEDFENAFQEENLLLSKDIVIGDKIVAELQKLPENSQKEFLHNARKHHVEFGKI